MKIKALLIALFFVAAVFSGPALADTAANPPQTRGKQAVGQRGVPKQYSNTPNQGQMRPEKHMMAGMHRASDLIGKKVVSRQGKDLGDIQNLVISPDGQVEYVVLSRGGVMGMGGHLVPIPWQTAGLQVHQNKVTADITPQQLQGAPSFNSDQWSKMRSPGYQQKVNGYFGTHPQSKLQGDPQQQGNSWKVGKSPYLKYSSQQGQSKSNFSKVYPGAGVTAHGAH